MTRKLSLALLIASAAAPMPALAADYDPPIVIDQADDGTPAALVVRRAEEARRLVDRKVDGRGSRRERAPVHLDPISCRIG